MARAAVMSTGLLYDLDSCCEEVLAFLRMLSWHIAAVEVKLWTSEGLPHGLRKWNPDMTDLERLAQEIAQFITENDMEIRATVLARPRAV